MQLVVPLDKRQTMQELAKESLQNDFHASIARIRLVTADILLTTSELIQENDHIPASCVITRVNEKKL